MEEIMSELNWWYELKRLEWEEEQEAKDEMYGAPDEIITGCEDEQGDFENE